jgi:AcrR family transcriptional regulator
MPAASPSPGPSRAASGERGSTRERVLEQATRVFNERGYDAVSHNELAGLLGMSRGNLAYHFKDKDALLAAICEDMWARIEAERRRSVQLPSFENLHQEVQLYFWFQKRYAFVFGDPKVLVQPPVRRRFRRLTRETIDGLLASIAFSVRIGNMKPEPWPGIYRNLALGTWMVAFYWLSQQIARGRQAAEDGEKLIWSLLVPHLTEKGLEAFRRYFGADALERLGEPFDPDVEGTPIF